jgi:hypothetical protein
MTELPRLLVGLTLGGFVVVALSAGCNPDDPVAGSGDDAGAVGDAPVNKDAPASGDSGGGGGGGICDVLIAYDTRCGNNTACDAKHHQDCPESVKLMSDALVAATIECTPNASCGDGGTKSQPLDNGCTFDKIRAAPRTAAQLALKAKFCGQCGAIQADCDNTFYGVSGNDAGKNGPGIFATLVNDTVVLQMQTKCLDEPTAADAGAKACTSFVLCSIGILETAGPPEPAECKDQ